MERSSARVWVVRGLALVLFGVLVAAAVLTWRFAEMVDREFLSVATARSDQVEILEVAAGRVVLEDTEAAARPGIWGLSGEDAYGQLTTITSRGDGRIERGLAMIFGEFSPGDPAVIDPMAFPSDPRTAMGLPFEEIRVPGDLGVNPAWLVSGNDDTWVVFVHGRGNGRRESLRALSTFRRLGMPMLAITYRNDGDGGVEAGSRSTWGLDEWRDLEVALETARLRGANDFILMGEDMGAGVVMSWLHESPSIVDVRGVILDSPILDLEELVDREADTSPYPAFIAVVGKELVRIRYGLEWSSLDQLERSSQFDPSIPILLFQGADSTVAPRETADSFVAAISSVRYEPVDGAGHGTVWNADPGRYDEVLEDFLLEVVRGLRASP